MNIVEFTESLVKSLVKNEDMVKVKSFGGEEDSVILEVIVSSEDIGTIIGKKGKMVKSLRIITQAYAYLNDNKKIKLNIDSF